MSDKRTAKLTRADTVKSRRQRWAWADRIPLGTVTVFAGRGGEGKSTFALDLAAKLNHGQLEGDLFQQAHPVIVISHEDDPGTVMKPRLLGAGADTSMIYFLTIEWVTDTITYESVPKLPMDLESLKESIRETGARLLIVDPITSTINGDLHKVETVRAALDPLNRLAQDLDIAVLAIMHFNKGAGNVSDKLSGSHAFRDVARSVMLFATDEDTGKRIVTIDKSNYSQERGQSFSFELQSVPVSTDDGAETTVARISSIEASDVSVADIVNRDSGGNEIDRNESQRFVLEFLMEHDGWEAIAGDVIKAGRAAGFTENEIKHARQRCKDPRITSVKGKSSRSADGSFKPSPWLWRIEESASRGAEGARNVPKVPTHENVESSAPSVASSSIDYPPVLEFKPRSTMKADR